LFILAGIALVVLDKDALK